MAVIAQSPTVIRAGFQRDMNTVHNAMAEILGGPLKILANRVITDETVTGPAAGLDLVLPTVRIRVKALPAIGEGSKAEPVGNILQDSQVTPLIFHSFSEGVPDSLASHQVPRTGGSEAGATDQGRTLGSFVSQRLSCSGIMVAGVTVVLPAPQVKTYVPNYAFELTGADGQYGAYLIVGDRLISQTVFVVPQNEPTLLMDYSSGNLRMLEARSTVGISPEVLALHGATFDRCVIVLQPIKTVDDVFLKMMTPSQSSHFDVGPSRFDSDMFRSPMRSPVTINPMIVDSGARTEMNTSTVNIGLVPSKQGIILAMNIVGITAYESVDKTGEGIEAVLGQSPPSKT